MLCEKYGNRCLACGDTEAMLEADHIVPLTRGGTDDIDNIQPLCGTCNRKIFVSVVDYRKLPVLLTVGPEWLPVVYGAADVICHEAFGVGGAAFSHGGEDLAVLPHVVVQPVGVGGTPG